MRISVVIPCYNAEPWIGEALRSVAEQTYPPHEIIVVDDGSTDASVQRIQDSGIDVKLLHRQHGNAAAARNSGIELATGDWIAFQDADDIWYPEHLERAAALLDGTGDVAFQSHADVVRSGVGLVKRKNRWPITQPTNGLPAERFVELFAGYLDFALPSVLVRRDVLIARGLFDPSLLRRHDMDMWLRVTNGFTWAYDPQAHLAYRNDTAGSVSRSSLASSEYWHLRMLMRHEVEYDSESFRWLLRRGARATMNTALTEGDDEDVKRARETAWPYLPGSLRVTYRMGMMCPPVFATANRMQRRVRWLLRRRGIFRRRSGG